MQSVQEFNPDVVQRELLTKWEQGNLQDALWLYWARFVPLVYKLNSDVEPLREERKARRLLFRPMEAFVCDGDPDLVLRELKEKDHPPQVCGRVFKMGEPTYSCRDCGMDPTCVLCIHCFQNSTHNTHRYKMSTSGGGGYCDCGDEEAWKTDAFCKVHKRGLEKRDNKAPIENLPPGLRARAEALFICVMRYAVKMLTWTDCDELPQGLQPETNTNQYATMLFNDEVHTYEQVISTLQRAIECTHKAAVDFATTVDREGRSCVKTGALAQCEKARQLIERQTSRHGNKPLKVLVMHSSVVAHQLFSQKILSWIQTVIANSDGLRQLFCLLSMRTLDGEMTSLVEKMMLADTQLWKSARILSRQLFMAGFLVDPECKKQFAILFTKIYPDLMQAFIQDDHDHSVCAVSESVQIYTVPTLCYPQFMRDFIIDDHFRPVSVTSTSVQLFTVPTLARMLITEHNLLQVILNAFLDQCQSKKKDDGKFAFERSDRNQSFRRAQYMLYDLKYALTCIPSPDEWTPALRTSFLKGFGTLLELLKCMQGMDPVQRETGQHIEFEPEWEGAFNLQLKLSDNIAVIQQWCATDETVLRAAFNATLDALHSCRSDTLKRETCNVQGHQAQCVKYDISSQKVSIHLPVTRLLAGLYTLLDKFNINPRSLHTSDHKVDPVELMEPSLRTQVMIAQTQASMWRRNGYSLLNQIYFYHNVRCQTEMYDKDIIMLQAGAALLDPNEYLVHMLYKFGLVNWAREDYDTVKLNPQEDLVRQIVTLAEEMLDLLITILGERYVPGVGEVSASDMVRREVIHQLCIQPMAHSELVKALPEDYNHETGIEGVVLDVAVFNKPAESGKGMYELKPECYKEYNPYFYHYVRADQSKSEEAQRSRKKAAGLDQALPPPVPPPFTGGFMPIRHLLDCDLTLYLMRLVLSRTSAQRSRSWSERQFEKVLHLIGLALHEERRAHETSDHTFKFIEKSKKGDKSVFELLEGLSGHTNITHEPAKNLLTRTIKNFHEVLQLRDASYAMDTSTLEDIAVDTARQEAERKKRADIASKRRARIMQQMSKMQRQFIKDNSELFDSTSTEIQPAEADMDVGSQAHAGNDMPVAVGPHRGSASGTATVRQTCILCQEEQDITQTGRAMVLAAFIQKSTVLSQERGRIIEKQDKYDPMFMPTSLIQGTHLSTCGHVLHADCWQRFYDAIVKREQRRTIRFRPHFSYDIEKFEFLCPLCETLSNSVIPLLPHLATLLPTSPPCLELSLNDWLDGMKKTVTASIREAWDQEAEEESYLFVPCPLSSITKMMADSVAKNFQLLFDYVYLDTSDRFSDSINDMLRKFSTDIYAVGLGVHPDDDNVRVPLAAWSSCAFTIMSTEQCLREEGKPLFGALATRQADCLSAMVRYAAACNQVFQPDVVKKHCINLLSALLLPSPSAHLQQTPCLLDIDMFHYMVSLCLALPTLYVEEDSASKPMTRFPSGDLSDLHVLQLTLTAHIVQIMLTTEFLLQESMETEDELDVEGEALAEVYLNVRQEAGIKATSKPTAWQVSTYVREACMPFLRCAALFFHYLTGVRPPNVLLERGPDEFEAILGYLSLPSHLSKLFASEQGTIITSLVQSWCSDDVVKQKLAASQSASGASTSKGKSVVSGVEAPLVRYPLPINQLRPLTSDYSQLINRVSTFTCPKSEGDDSRAPTMCLVCGEMLCSQSYCCQTELEGLTVGAATAHAHTCGAGTGLFLRVRECQVLLLSGRTKGSFYAPPYLDDYGETDQGLRRGNPLHLCPERYQKLQKLWLSHAIPETIAHSLESNNNLLSIDWHHL